MDTIRRDRPERDRGAVLASSPISSGFSRIRREIFWVTFGQALAVLGAIAGVRLLTSLLDPSVYGELALGMTLAGLIGQTVMGPIANAASRFFPPAREKNDVPRYLVALRRFLVKGTAIVVLLAGSVLLFLVLAGRIEWFWLGVSACCFSLLSGYNTALNGLQNAARERAIVAWHLAFSSWGRFLIAAGMVLWLGATSAAAMFGYLVATLLVLISQMLFFRRTLRAEAKITLSEAPSGWESQMFSYSWPFAAWGMLTWAQMASDRWGLQLFASTRDVGLYATLYMVGYYPVSIATDLVVQFMAPVLFQRAGDASSVPRLTQVFKVNRRLAYVALGLTAFAFPTTWVFHAYVFHIVVAPEYVSVSYLLPWMVLAGGFFAAGQIASLNMMSSLSTITLLRPKIITGVLGVGLNLLGAASFGIRGVVAANVLFSVVYLVWVFLISHWSVHSLVGGES